MSVLCTAKFPHVHWHWHPGASFLISTLVVLLALNLSNAYDFSLTKWLKVPNHHYHCSQDSKTEIYVAKITSHSMCGHHWDGDIIGPVRNFGWTYLFHILHTWQNNCFAFNSPYIHYLQSQTLVPYSKAWLCKTCIMW